MGICCVILIKFLNERMAVGGEREAGGSEPRERKVRRDHARIRFSSESGLGVVCLRSYPSLYTSSRAHVHLGNVLAIIGTPSDIISSCD